MWGTVQLYWAILEKEVPAVEAYWGSEKAINLHKAD